MHSPSGTETRTRLRIALVQPQAVAHWEEPWLPEIIARLRNSTHEHDFDLVDSVAEADLQVFFESGDNDTVSPTQGEYLRGGIPAACVNYLDVPYGFLPGVYTSLARHRFDPAIHRSLPSWSFPNVLIDGAEPSSPDHADLLFSFLGNPDSNQVRLRLIRTLGGETGRWDVRAAGCTYDTLHRSDFESYIALVHRSRFVLCPAGYAAYSHRIIETLALGRVPVVIADDWVPFSIAEEGYFVRIKERDIAGIPELLARLDYRMYHRRALAVYHKYFRREVRLSVILNQIVALYRANPRPFQPDAIQDRWNSLPFQTWQVLRSTKRRLGRVKGRIKGLIT
jgi:hypothetical protein